jgi:hypothetical protein
MTVKIRMWRIVAACALSGIIAGLLSATQCRAAESDCHIAALQALSSEPVSWTLWLNWINWLPGLVFGLLFAFATVEGTSFYGRRVLLYALASAAVYVAAGLVFSVFLNIAGEDEFSLILWMWPAGLSAGLIGALLLELGAHRLLSPRPSGPARLSRFALPVAVGAMTGLLFVLICSYGEQHILVAWPIAFVLWQVSVGLSLMPPAGSHGRPGDRGPKPDPVVQ